MTDVVSGRYYSNICHVTHIHTRDYCRYLSDTMPCLTLSDKNLLIPNYEDLQACCVTYLKWQQEHIVV